MGKLAKALQGQVRTGKAKKHGMDRQAEEGSRRLRMGDLLIC